jgi:hypothetical protein
VIPLHDRLVAKEQYRKVQGRLMDVPAARLNERDKKLVQDAAVGTATVPSRAKGVND